MKLSVIIKITLVTAVSVCAFLVFNACKKNKASYNIAVSGKLMPHGSVLFSTNASGSSYSWDFGDGTTSSLASPQHTYRTTGSYLVTVATNGGSIVATNTIKITPQAKFFEGNRHWTGGRCESHEVSGIDTSWALNDTTFAITALSDSILEVWGQSIPYFQYTTSFYNDLPYFSPEIRYANDTIYFRYYNASGLAVRLSTTYYTR